MIAASMMVCGARAQDKPAAKPEAATATKRAYQNLSPEEFDKLRREKKDAVVLDVRTKEEYEKGHIPGSVLIDFTSDDFAKEVAKLDKNKTYLVHCGSGGRSARACNKMGQAQFTNLFNLEGGMTAWQKAGKPVAK